MLESGAAFHGIPFKMGRAVRVRWFSWLIYKVQHRLLVLVSFVYMYASHSYINAWVSLYYLQYPFYDHCYYYLIYTLCVYFGLLYYFGGILVVFWRCFRSIFEVSWSGRLSWMCVVVYEDVYLLLACWLTCFMDPTRISWHFVIHVWVINIYVAEKSFRYASASRL